MKTKNLAILILIVISFLLIVNISNANAGCCLIPSSLGSSEGICLSESEGATASSCGGSNGNWIFGDCSERDSCTIRGCCIVDGNCNDGSNAVSCDNRGDYNPRPCAETPGCINVCCSVPNPGGYIFMPENQCNEIQGTVQDSAIDETSCENLNNGVEGTRGCCNYNNGTCISLLRDDCNNNGGTPYTGFACSVSPGCDCDAKYRTGPGVLEGQQNKVYWFDSCGNQEEIVRATDPVSAFTAINVQPFNGDCDSDPLLSVNPTSNGQFNCSIVKCENVWDNPRTDENHDGNLKNDRIFTFGSVDRNYRYNNESWCEYQQAKVGVGLDLPGTRHYKHYCDRGVERVEVSGSGRDQVCVEKIKEIQRGGNTILMSEANWVENSAGSAETCLRCNIEAEGGNIIGCCNFYPNCAYVLQKSVDGKYNLDITMAQFNDLNDAVDKATEFLKLRYWKGDSLISEVDFKVNVRGLNNCNDVDGKCRLEILNPVSGEVRLSVYGKGCVGGLGVDVKCEKQKVDLGNHILSPGEGDGVCVPLVPPSSNETCSLFSDIPRLSEVNDGSFNFYYDTPYNSFGKSGCDGTLECKPPSSFTDDNKRYFQILDDRNSLCKAFGECGFNSNLLKKVGPSDVSNLEFFEAYDRNVNSSDYINIEKNKIDNLIGGKPNIPISSDGSTSIFFFLPIPFLFRKMKKRILLFLLLIIILILAGCASDDKVTFSKSRSNLSCESWRPTFGAADCNKCNLNESSGGVLPDVNLTLPDGSPAYQCTKSLCSSLGSCDFQETNNIGSESFGVCVPHTSYSKPKIVFLDANFTCNSLTPNGCQPGNVNIQNTESPSLIIAGDLEENTPINISFKTIGTLDVSGDFPTTCTYGLSRDDQSQSIESGHFGVSHNFYLPYVASNNLEYVYFIQCTDAQGDAAPNPGQVKFKVSRGPDIANPIILEVIPESSKYVKFNESTKEVTLLTLGQINNCRWDNESNDYENMNVADPGGSGDNVVALFGCNNNGNPQSRANVCSTTVHGIKFGENKFWFSCIGPNNLASPPSPEEGFTLIGTDKLNISNINCYNEFGTNCTEIYGNVFNFSITTSGGAESGSAKCSWSIDQYDFDCFKDPGCSDSFLRVPNYAVNHVQNGFTTSGNALTLKFFCSDLARNTVEKNISINILNDNISPKILRTYKDGNSLLIQTDEVSKCYYVTNLTTIFTDESNQFITNYGLEHQVNIDTNFYKVRCEDRFTNGREVNIYISKL